MLGIAVGSQIRFKDYVALMYHEARNVRHLIRAGHFGAQGWEKIVSLPTNRRQAWLEVDQFADSIEGDAEYILDRFARRYGQTLDDLVTMFENPNWKHAATYGGNAWARIGKKVVALGRAMQDDDIERSRSLENDLRVESHNTGTVAAKLEKLRNSADKRNA